MKYRFISDPGHGWVEVKINELHKLGITQAISRYSYQHQGNAYLEEDCDAAVFMDAKRAAGEPVELVEVYQEVTPIRNYPSFGG
jgi:hypothetical protein